MNIINYKNEYIDLHVNMLNVLVVVMISWTLWTISVPLWNLVRGIGFTLTPSKRITLSGVVEELSLLHIYACLTISVNFWKKCLLVAYSDWSTMNTSLFGHCHNNYPSTKGILIPRPSTLFFCYIIVLLYCSTFIL